jgi:hypothetical protein
MKTLLLSAIVLLAGVIAHAQNAGKCFTGVLNDTRLNIYLDKDSANGKFVVIRDEGTDSTVLIFTYTVKENYIYPSFATDNLEIEKGTVIGKEPFKLVKLAGVNTIRISVIKTKGSAKTTSVLMLAACDE